MEQQFNATLTGTEGPVAGTIKHVTYTPHRNAYRFDSVDDTLHMIVVPGDKGNWERIDGTEPYISGWVDEMAEQISKFRSQN